MALYTPDDLKRAANTWAEGAFLFNLCAGPGFINIGLAMLVNSLDDNRKGAITEELERIGAIEFVDNTWRATPKGHEINDALMRRL